jgi:phage/plasmid-like protein (TIGR03299 family)
MPAGLSIQNGRVEMMYVGEVPWHGLGVELETPATAAQAIKYSGLDWEVTKVLLYRKVSRKYLEIPERFGTVRADQLARSDAEVLGIVGRGYTPLQNRDAFAWFDGIVGAGRAVYHTAGALGCGERVWILAKLPGEIRVVGEDITDKFLLLSNSHDGESSVQVKFTPIRVVCQNTLTMALSRGPTFRVSHTASLEQRMEQVKENLGIIGSTYETIQKQFQAMTKVQLDQARLQTYLISVFPDPQDKKDERAQKRVAEARTTSAVLFESGRGNNLAGVKGTLWAGYNGVAEYIDFRATKQTRSERLNSIWFGSGYLTKARAFKAAVTKAIEWGN